MPNFLLRGIIQVQTPFGYFDEMMYQYYSMNQGDDEVIFSESERKFVTQAKEIVGDKVVYNLPYDGSFFAYQSDGLPYDLSSSLYRAWSKRRPANSTIELV